MKQTVTTLALLEDLTCTALRSVFTDHRKLFAERDKWFIS